MSNRINIGVLRQPYLSFQWARDDHCSTAVDNPLIFYCILFSSFSLCDNFSIRIWIARKKQGFLYLYDKKI